MFILFNVFTRTTQIKQTRNKINLLTLYIDLYIITLTHSQYNKTQLHQQQSGLHRAPSNNTESKKDTLVYNIHGVCN